MKHGTFISITFVFLAVCMTAEAASNSKTADCARMLAKHAEQFEDETLPWAKMAPLLNSVGSATIIVRLPLENLSVPLGSLTSLLQSRSGLTLSPDLQALHKGDLIVVAAGSKSSLLSWGAKLEEFGFAGKPAYQVLEFSAGQWFKIPRPERTYILNEHNTKEVEQGIEKSMVAKEDFIVLDMTHARVQPLIFISRKDLPENQLTRLLESQKIESYHLRRQPSSWVKWVRQRSGNFTKASVALALNWIVFSAEAHKKAVALETALRADVPETAGANPKLLEEIQRRITSAPEAVREPRAQAPPTPSTKPPEVQGLSVPALNAVLDVLREHATSPKISQEGGVEAAFLELARYVPENQREGFKKQIRQVEFTKYTYRMLNEEEPSEVNLGRVETAWRIFLRSAGRMDSFADSISARSVKDDMKALAETI